MIDTALLVRLLRVTSGCILYFYVFTHLVNHSLGLIALETMEIGRSLFLRFWRHDALFYLLYGALLIHFLLGIYALCRKRSFKMSKKEWIRNSCAVLIPFFLASHLSITLWGSRFLGLNDTYSFMILSTYLFDPIGYILLGLMLVVVWVHGSIGILGLLEFRKVYSDYKGFFHGIMFGLPLLAYGGYLNASIELTKVGEGNPLAILEILATANFTKEIGADITLLSDYLQFLIYPALLLAMLVFVGLRRLVQKKFYSIQVNYMDGTSVNVSKGSSLLEASHRCNRYHESVCGGRGRCTTCRVRVTSSLNDLPTPNKIEQRVIDRLDFDPSIRLACQLRPEKNIQVNPLISLMSSEKKKLKYNNQEHLTGLEKDAVIMFCDLRGFTTLSEGKMPFDVVFILNKYFKLVTEAVTINRGRIDKFIGDGVMAIFDQDLDTTTNCRNALYASSKIAGSLNLLNSELSDEDIDTLRIGIGIHTGTAILGKMGYGQASSETAIGDTVNVASRLEQLTKNFSCQLMFSAAVAEKASLNTSLLKSVETEIRGRKDLLQAFYCNNAEEAMEAFQ